MENVGAFLADARIEGLREQLSGRPQGTPLRFVLCASVALCETLLSPAYCRSSVVLS